MRAQRRTLAECGAARCAAERSGLSGRASPLTVTYLGKCPTFGQFEAKVQFTQKILPHRLGKPQQVEVVNADRDSQGESIELPRTSEDKSVLN
jgi:hypothetical protein